MWWSRFRNTLLLLFYVYYIFTYFFFTDFGLGWTLLSLLHICPLPTYTFSASSVICVVLYIAYMYTYLYLSTRVFLSLAVYTIIIYSCVSGDKNTNCPTIIDWQWSNYIIFCNTYSYKYLTSFSRIQDPATIIYIYNWLQP